MLNRAIAMAMLATLARAIAWQWLRPRFGNSRKIFQNGQKRGEVSVLFCQGAASAFDQRCFAISCARANPQDLACPA